MEEQPKQIDLGPNNYRKLRNGRWHLPDDPKLHRNAFFVALGILGFIYWRHTELTPDVLFGVVALLAFCAGIMFANWLKDVY